MVASANTIKLLNDDDTSSWKELYMVRKVRAEEMVALRKDDTHKSRSVNNFSQQLGRPV